jgi:hypothetical protein
VLGCSTASRRTDPVGLGRSGHFGHPGAPSNPGHWRLYEAFPAGAEQVEELDALPDAEVY